MPGPTIFPVIRPMIFLILSLSKDAGNHPAQTFAEVPLDDGSSGEGNRGIRDIRLEGVFLTPSYPAPQTPPSTTIVWPVT